MGASPPRQPLGRGPRAPPPPVVGRRDLHAYLNSHTKRAESALLPQPLLPPASHIHLSRVFYFILF